jgi:hypothetical protein
MNEYHFITHWQVEGTAQEVYDVINDVTSLTRWWPSVYLDVTLLDPGDEHGIGKPASLYTKGWLPYTLRRQLRVTETNCPCGSALEAEGDLNGRGIWTFEQAGPMVNITYDWKVIADKPLLRMFSFLFKPIFSANHRWAMAQGEESLKLELARRRAASPEDAARIPSPPGPTFPHNLARQTNDGGRKRKERQKH